MIGVSFANPVVNVMLSNKINEISIVEVIFLFMFFYPSRRVNYSLINPVLIVWDYV
ncbi:MAG: hypothetical protein ABIE23_00670 [archaeon]